MGNERRYACPICASDAPARADNAFFPFCSRSCKLVDLGKWLDGDYRIAGEPASDEDASHPSGAATKEDEGDE
jgi:endogenous inhibitor of DNA gyrase (YacG/DUF329 family)